MEPKTIKRILIFALLFSALCITETVFRKSTFEVQKEAIYVSVYGAHFVIKR